MSEHMWAFGTLNAKRLTAEEVANSFVMPAYFPEVCGMDHCYVVGPRGSGKTTILRMLEGKSLMAWTGRDADVQKRRVTYSAIFLPADELWASQLQPDRARAAFTCHMLGSFIATIEYRSQVRSPSRNQPVHYPVELPISAEVQFVEECTRAWGVSVVANTLTCLQAALDLYLTRLGDPEFDSGRIGGPDSLELLRFGIRAFNRIVGQPDHRWALLLDEMELAPPEVHNEVQRFIRGGAGNLILKASMSPFDRYIEAFASASMPMPAYDYRIVYLSGLARRDIQRFTEGLWRGSMRVAGFAPVPLGRALDPRARRDRMSRSDATLTRTDGPDAELRSLLLRTRERDPSFARWLERRRIDPDALAEVSYDRRSATIRKIAPLLVFRQAIEQPERDRGRKKPSEAFTGSDSVVAALEGNPRWIKSVCADMLRYYDESTERVAQGFQYDALLAMAKRFEALLRVLPSRDSDSGRLSVPDLIDAIARYMHSSNTGPFTADPQNCFTVDRAVSRDVKDALVLALYAGAIIHVRDRRSPGVLGSLVGQRFRLAYILGVREGKEFPLRLGKDAALSTILQENLPQYMRRPALTVPYKQLELGDL